MKDQIADNSKSVEQVEPVEHPVPEIHPEDTSPSKVITSATESAFTASAPKESSTETSSSPEPPTDSPVSILPSVPDPANIVDWEPTQSDPVLLNTPEIHEPPTLPLSTEVHPVDELPSTAVEAEIVEKADKPNDILMSDESLPSPDVNQPQEDAVICKVETVKEEKINKTEEDNGQNFKESEETLQMEKRMDIGEDPTDRRQDAGLGARVS
jgi:hypothetical protein